MVLIIVMLIIAWLCSLVEVTTLVSYHHPFTAGELFAWVTANGYEVGDISSYCMRYVWPFWLLCTLVFVGFGWGALYLLLCKGKIGRILSLGISFLCFLPFILLPIRMNLLRESSYVYQQIRTIERHQNDNMHFRYNAYRSDCIYYKEVYVLAIGESVRYKNFSLNGAYKRETAPLLKLQ